MAHFLIDALTGNVLDAQAVLAVQQLFDANQGVNNDRVGEVEVPQEQGADDDDTFQCGKCKCKFTTLPDFFAHKKEPCSGRVSTSLCDPATAPALSIDRLSVSQLQAALASKSQVILSEAELLALSSPLEGPLDLQAAASTEGPIVLTRSPSLVQDAAVVVPHQNTACPPVTLSGLTEPIQSPTSARHHHETECLVRKIALTKTPSVSSEKEVEFVVGDVEQAAMTATMPDHYEAVQEVEGCDTASSKSCRQNQNMPESSQQKKAKNETCPFCAKGFSKNFDLQQHIRSHTGDKPFQCVICGRAFAQKSNVKKHMQTHKVWPNGLSQTLPPQLVVESFMIPEGTSESKEPSTGIKDNRTKALVLDNTYICHYCPYVGKSYCELKTHMKQHRHEKVFKCIVGKCGQMFNDLESFLAHAKIHENEMVYHCQLCPKTMASLYDLSVHQFTHSLYASNAGASSTSRVHRCSHCLNKYATAEALAHHEATCTHNYPCPVCTKVFPCERYLRRHLLIHRDASPHVCPVCKKAFKTEHYLKVHSVIHTNEKPFLCSQCGATFNRQDKLKRHMLVHDTVKRFKCPYAAALGCQMEFNRADKLKAHLFTHSGIKPYACRTCGRCFAQKTRLKNHERLHSSAPFQCSTCQQAFVSQKALDEHNCRKRVAHTCRGRGRKWSASRCAMCKPTLLSKACDQAAIPDEGLTDVQTAHIEIISTTGDIGVGKVSITYPDIQPTSEPGKQDE
ncbi:zinc finger protein 341-like isoform X2 [Ornithodoros turicata]|uniref:zinc finger protein 341-like isoform X2 n=1 Tax=Ornithodoros turicata TaxID=34597 RepID=UPI0031389EC1